MIHIYHGDGKGKTTAAMGLALRMIGYGEPVFAVQFLKGSLSGEIAALLKLAGVTILRGKPGTKFVFQMCPKEIAEIKVLHMRQLGLAFEAAYTGKAKLLLLDEVLDAVSTATIEEDTLLDLIKGCPNDVEIVLTGRNPSQSLIQIADYVTEMKNIKHPYQQGIPARKGVEY